MIAAELDAAGLFDPRLRAAYQRCRELNARHGRTYYLATRLLTPAQRPAVHALYGFARWADDIVDDVPPGTSTSQVAARLDGLRRDLFDGLRRGSSGNPILAAVVDTIGRYQLAPDLFAGFMDSMRMDLEVTSYPDRAALDRYVHGSAEVIGLQVLPVLGTVGPRAEAARYAAALGQAFQLTNFLRDVAEDLDRGRIYLPADELAAFGVDADLLRWCHARRRTDPRVRDALADQHATTRAIYRYASAGIARLKPSARPCVATALTLYSEILDRIEELDFAVFAHRARVGKARRLQVAAPALARALWARRGAA
jgi:phytoene synthase